MIKERINELRDLLNNISSFENLNDAEIVRISQELDRLIIEYYRIMKLTLQFK